MPVLTTLAIDYEELGLPAGTQPIIATPTSKDLSAVAHFVEDTLREISGFTKLDIDSSRTYLERLLATVLNVIAFLRSFPASLSIGMFFKTKFQSLQA